MFASLKDRPLMGSVVFFAVVLTVSNILLLVGRPPLARLSASEVADSAHRLARLAARTALAAPHSDAVLQLTYLPADACGTPQGLAVLTQFGRDNRPAPPETQLWFRVEAWTVLPRDPADEPPPTVVAVRDELGSDLVGTTEAGHLRVVLVEPAAGDGEQPITLRLNNLAGTRRWPMARGEVPELHRLAAPAERCGLTAEDLELLRVLARVVRARVCDDLDTAGSPCHDVALALYRDRIPDQFRLDLRTLGEQQGMLALALELRRDTTDQPLLMEYRVLPGSDLSKPATLFFTRPSPAGEVLTDQGEGFHGLRYQPRAGAGSKAGSVDLRGKVEIRRLLEHTSWLGLPPSEEDPGGD